MRDKDGQSKRTIELKSTVQKSVIVVGVLAYVCVYCMCWERIQYDTLLGQCWLAAITRNRL